MSYTKGLNLQISTFLTKLNVQIPLVVKVSLNQIAGKVPLSDAEKRNRKAHLSCPAESVLPSGRDCQMLGVLRSTARSQRGHHALHRRAKAARQVRR